MSPSKVSEVWIRDSLSITNAPLSSEMVLFFIGLQPAAISILLDVYFTINVNVLKHFQEPRTHRLSLLPIVTY